MSSNLYLLPKGNTNIWNIDANDLSFNLTSTVPSPATFIVNIDNTSRFSINPPIGSNIAYITVNSTKIFVQSTDPALVGGAVSAGDIWINTTAPA
jgi:hypothetical protein